MFSHRHWLPWVAMDAPARWFTRYREPLLLGVCAMLLVIAVLTTPWVALAVPLIMMSDWLALRQLQPTFDVDVYRLNSDEQTQLDAAAAAYVDARRQLNRMESTVRERGYRIEEGVVRPDDEHAERLQADLDQARADLDPEAVLSLSRLPVERADRALQRYPAQLGARWGLYAFPIGVVLGLPLARYALVCGGIASCIGYMLASHIGSRRVVNFLLSLPQAMPQFERDAERREQALAAARSLARGRRSS